MFVYRLRPMSILIKVTVVASMVLLVACTSSNGPVVIRDATSVNNTGSVEHSSSHSVTLEATPEPDRVQPVLPSPQVQQAALSPPLKDKLLKQSKRQLTDGNVKSAIVLAERGLRIDRKEAGFYLVLAKSYQSLGDIQQSQKFAEQGLRYAPRDTQYFRELNSLAR